MSTLDIQTALDTQLKTVVGLPTLQTENNRFDASSSIPSWCRATLMPANSNVIAIGTGAMKQMQGLYQVDVFALTGTNTTAARTIADAVVDAFTVGQRLTSGSSTVIVEVASVMTAYAINKYYCIPVRIQWSVYA